MEEILDHKHKNNMPVLPQGVSALLMTEEEFNTLPKGEEYTPQLKKPVKKLTVPAKKTNNPNKQTKSLPRYVKPNVQECQPT